MGENIPVQGVDQYDFLEHRREQEKKHWSKQSNATELSSILTVEVNTTELCNRTCVFCPRHDPKVFPNRNLHMTPKGAETIAKELGRNNFNGKISFSGFGGVGIPELKDGVVGFEGVELLDDEHDIFDGKSLVFF